MKTIDFRHKVVQTDQTKTEQLKKLEPRSWWKSSIITIERTLRLYECRKCHRGVWVTNDCTNNMWSDMFNYVEAGKEIETVYGWLSDEGQCAVGEIKEEQP